ncbi:DnaJ domain-containing protein [Emiliania huxleyi virus 202]|nr:DnaJ domain-containing protein [Emiliania huxleyi virus 202]AHA54464.1 DnaJ domain-containing protein [Emiliania huxleyi virus 18]AHA55508.1 DnaJ domain-containing protein [Emiliania huxleyi virus 156]
MQYITHSVPKQNRIEEQKSIITEILAATTIWEVLGLPNECRDFKPSLKGIRTEYLKRSRLIHPDKCSLDNSEEASRLLNTAYQDIVNKSKTFRPHNYSEADTSSSRKTPPPEPKRPSSKEKRTTRREYEAFYKTYKRLKEDELILFRKTVEAESEMTALEEDIEVAKTNAVQQRLHRARTAYVKMMIDTRLSKLSPDLIIKLATDINTEPSCDSIRSWATCGQENTISRPYYINKFIVDNVQNRPRALARKDKNDLSLRNAELNKDAANERHDQIRIIYLTSTLRATTTVRDDYQKKHEEQIKETSVLYDKLIEMEKNIGTNKSSHKRNRFGFF